MKYLLLGLVLVGGCAHQTPEQREAERQQRERCARLELYPMGLTPSRPYRVLGPVSAYNEVNPALRDRQLQQQACNLGADAVMDVRPETAQQDATAGVAIVYIVEPPPSAP